MCVHDVAFKLSRASSSTTYLKHCGRDQNLVTTTCLRTVVGHGGMLPVNTFTPIEPLLCQSNVIEIIRQS